MTNKLKDFQQETKQQETTVKVDETTTNSNDELIKQLLETTEDQYLPVANLVSDLLVIKFFEEVHKGFIKKVSEASKKLPISLDAKTLEETKKRLLTGQNQKQLSGAKGNE